MSTDTVYFTHMSTPFGKFFLAGDGESLRMTRFSSSKHQLHPEPQWIEDAAALRFATLQLEEYFAGERREFDLALDIRGTEFQKLVWSALQQIPFGSSRSYGDIAHAIGRPTASRAVGAANGANALPLIIPCHRVIGANGSLTGFGGGLPTKQWLLRFEGVLPGEQAALF